MAQGSSSPQDRTRHQCTNSQTGSQHPQLLRDMEVPCAVGACAAIPGLSSEDLALGRRVCMQGANDTPGLALDQCTSFTAEQGGPSTGRFCRGRSEDYPEGCSTLRGRPGSEEATECEGEGEKGADVKKQGHRLVRELWGEPEPARAAVQHGGTHKILDKIDSFSFGAGPEAPSNVGYLKKASLGSGDSLPEFEGFGMEGLAGLGAEAFKWIEKHSEVKLRGFDTIGTEASLSLVPWPRTNFGVDPSALEAGTLYELESGDQHVPECGGSATATSTPGHQGGASSTEEVPVPRKRATPPLASGGAPHRSEPHTGPALVNSGGRESPGQQDTPRRQGLAVAATSRISSPAPGAKPSAPGTRGAKAPLDTDMSLEFLQFKLELIALQREASARRCEIFLDELLATAEPGRASLLSSPRRRPRVQKPSPSRSGQLPSLPGKKGKSGSLIPRASPPCSTAAAVLRRRRMSFDFGEELEFRSEPSRNDVTRPSSLRSSPAAGLKPAGRPTAVQSSPAAAQAVPRQVVARGSPCCEGAVQVAPGAGDVLGPVSPSSSDHSSESDVSPRDFLRPRPAFHSLNASPIHPLVRGGTTKTGSYVSFSPLHQLQGGFPPKQPVPSHCSPMHSQARPYSNSSPLHRNRVLGSPRSRPLAGQRVTMSSSQVTKQVTNSSSHSPPQGHAWGPVAADEIPKTGQKGSDANRGRQGAQHPVPVGQLGTCFLNTPSAAAVQHVSRGSPHLTSSVVAPIYSTSAVSGTPLGHPLPQLARPGPLGPTCAGILCAASTLPGPGMGGGACRGALPSLCSPRLWAECGGAQGAPAEPAGFPGLGSWSEHRFQGGGGRGTEPDAEGAQQRNSGKGPPKYLWRPEQVGGQAEKSGDGLPVHCRSPGQPREEPHPKTGLVPAARSVVLAETRRFCPSQLVPPLNWPQDS